MFIQNKDDAVRYEGISFAVPIFHAYAHKASCQVSKQFLNTVQSIVLLQVYTTVSIGFFM